LTPGRTKWRFAAPLILILAAVTGAAIHHDYGVGWDEETQREIGLVTWNYLSGAGNDLESYNCRDHGVIFELVLIAAEKIARASSFREIFFLRHMVSHLFFLLGAYFFYRLGLLIYRAWRPALFAMLLLLLHPVLYGQSYFNSKDLPFLSLLTICFYAHARAVTERKWTAIVVCGMLVGLLINIRLAGLVFLALFALSHVAANFLRKEWKSGILTATLLVSVSLITLYVSWPFLWSDPIVKFTWLLDRSASFPFDNSVLFMGDYTPAPQLPWYYVPWWFAVSTPVLYLIAGSIGLGLLIKDMFNKAWWIGHSLSLQQHVLFALCFFLPLAAIMALHSVVYDGWRHMFFIYPGFALLASYCAWRMFGSAKRFSNLAFAAFVPAFIFMVKDHPFQHLFFNALTRRESPSFHLRSEVDHWGLTYKQGLEYILAHDTASRIGISAQNIPCDLNVRMLTPSQRRRIRMTVIGDSDYFLTNFRWHPARYTEKELAGREWHAITVQGKTALMIFRLKHDGEGKTGR
jgi:hypothetical protein